MQNQNWSKCAINNQDDEEAVAKFSENFEKDKLDTKGFKLWRQVDIYKLDISLYQAIISPEKHKHARLPAPFYVPTYTYQQKTTFSINLNANGAAWVCVNMGQYLDSSKYKSGAVGSQNGSSTTANSNVFVTSSSFAAYNPNTSPIADAENIGTNILGLNVMQMPNGNFNAVRCGGMSISYQFTGNLVSTQGKVFCGINYTLAPNPQGTFTTYENGLLPDYTYSTPQLIQDCPYSRHGALTDSFKAVFIPQDYSILNLKPPTGPASQNGIAEITICSNWEGVPSKTTQDWVTTSYSYYPPNYNGEVIFNYILKNNLVITKDDDELGINKFIQGYYAAGGQGALPNEVRTQLNANAKTTAEALRIANEALGKVNVIGAHLEGPDSRRQDFNEYQQI